MTAPRRLDPVVLILLGAAVVYAALLLDRGWIPHDDGTLGETALRVLQGQLPHRDFSDVYTGGLAYWNALSFALFGVNLLAPRILLFLSFLGFLAASYAIARRFAGARTSAAVVLCMSVWGMPNYPAAMPTWYNAFLAVGAVWGLARYLESPRTRWLLFAGACAGVSMLAKLTGLYTLAGLLLAVGFFEQATSGTPTPPPSPGDAAVSTSEGLPWYSIVLSVAGLTFVLLVLRLIAVNLTLASAVHFVLPASLVVALMIYLEWRQPSVRSSGERLRTGVRSVGALVIGALVPVFSFAALYGAAGALDDLTRGVLVSPLERLTEAILLPPSLGQALPALGLFLVLVLGGWVRGVSQWALLGGTAAALVTVLVVGGDPTVFQGVWSANVIAAPVCVAVGVLILGRTLRGVRQTPTAGSLSRELQPLLAAALVAQLAVFGLVQYPFSGSIYTLYVGCLVPLVALALISLGGRRARLPGVLILVFALAFGVRWMGTANIVTVGFGGYEPRRDTERLRMERGGIRVTPEEREEFEMLVATLQVLAPGQATLALPDAPEVYFLSGLQNPTGVLFDLFDSEEGRVQRVLRTLEEHDVGVVVIKTTPSISGAPPLELMVELQALYPVAMEIGSYLVVRRDDLGR